MIRVQAADRELKSKEARIVFYLSYIVRYLRAQSAKEPESARWVGVLDVRVPHGYKGGCSCESRPDFIRHVSTDFPKVWAPTAFARVGNAVFLGRVQVLDDLSRRAACFFTRARHIPREYANALRNVRPRRDGQVE